MRLFLTGITGFVGLHVARLAQERGDHVVGSHIGDRAEPEWSDVELVEVDVVDEDAMASILATVRPDGVIHLAGLASVGKSWGRMADYFRVNVRGTESLLRAVGRWETQKGEPVPVVVASSSEVYGPVPEDEQPISEDRDPAPASPYALTKAAAERLAVSGLVRHPIVARSFNMIGPGQDPSFALPAFAGQLAAIHRGDREPVLHVGNLAARRDFLHVADGAAAYLRLVDRGGAGVAYNIARGEACSIEEVLRRLLEVSGVDARVDVDPDRVRPVDLPLLCGDATRLRGLDWEPSRTVQDALDALWRHALEAESS